MEEIKQNYVQPGAMLAGRWLLAYKLSQLFKGIVQYLAINSNKMVRHKLNTLMELMANAQISLCQNLVASKTSTHT